MATRAETQNSADEEFFPRGQKPVSTAAVVITRFFYGRVAPLYVAGLTIFLMGMSYVTEYYRSKKRKK